MKRIIKQFLFPFILCLMYSIANRVMAQDLHFSQYFNSPLIINPANTGFIPDGDYRYGINYRNQWSNVTDNPYKTFSVYGDAQLFGDRLENGWVGIGGALLRDVAGSGSLTSTKGFASIAYHQALGLGSLLSAGFNVGVVNKRVDFTKLTFDNQWNGKFIDANIPSGEAFAVNQVNYLTLQAGINYAYYPNENTYINAGVSVGNLNTPKESFFNTEVAEQTVLRRYTAFLNGSFKAGDNTWIINPNVYVSKMGTAWEYVFGANAQRNLSGDGNTQLIIGGYYRVKDAIIPMVGFQQNSYKLTFSFDATTSGLQPYNNTRGAYELSLVKQGLIDRSKPLKCPAVRF